MYTIANIIYGWDLTAAYESHPEFVELIDEMRSDTNIAPGVGVLYNGILGQQCYAGMHLCVFYTCANVNLADVQFHPKQYQIDLVNQWLNTLETEYPVLFNRLSSKPGVYIIWGTS
jgi:hypothetical protein